MVYTPRKLADFVVKLLKSNTDNDDLEVKTILDPSSGEGSLLEAAQDVYGQNKHYIGIDVDKRAVNSIKDKYEIILDDTIIPQKSKTQTVAYWKKELPPIDIIIANPPWSSEKIYTREKISKAGFLLGKGQYDSYVLFLELSLNLISTNGYLAFIIPDSLFEAQNEDLRRLLATQVQIKVIARLGEKIFNEVNRATTVIICKKTLPMSESLTTCFRLSTKERKHFLQGAGSLIDYYNKNAHRVKQTRFLANASCNFDIDTRSNEESLLNKITSNTISWKDVFFFGRGVEISKHGMITYCPSCGKAQGYKKKQLSQGYKDCTYCGALICLNDTTTESIISTSPGINKEHIYVGENIKRYGIDGQNYIKKNIDGINYKNEYIYKSPKLLIRKTGLGIYCAADYTGTITNQTVYILKYKDNNTSIPLHYYLALINSRVVYYYYLKVYGENEWKSHPYLTKKILFSLPLRPYNGDELDKHIIALSKKLMNRYDYVEDTNLEKLIMDKYHLTTLERQLIYDEMNQLPDLSAINNMKVKNTNV